MRRRLFAACLAAFLLCAGAARADDSSACSRLWEFLQYNCNGAAKAWDGNDWDLYLPGYVHHGHGTYSSEKLATLNSSAWGGGVGKRYVDEDNRTHFIYTAVYQDSHYKPEYFAGYGWLAHWKPWDDAGLRIGGGFTATVTLKSSYGNYMVPVPVLLPIAEIAFDKFSVMGLYVPRLSSNKGNGDVLLLWGRYAF